MIHAGTVTVNAAFLQEIKEDHRLLKDYLGRATECFSPVAVTRFRAPDVVELLGRLRDQLAVHFSLEEAYGYFHDAISAAPHFSYQAERLLAEHQALYAGICQLAEEGERLLYTHPPAHVWETLNEGFQTFMLAFETHEAAENDLILSAFEDDLGTGD
jgi:hypothetical protein